jgi:flagellar biosynthesis regulator FlaF
MSARRRPTCSAAQTPRSAVAAGTMTQVRALADNGLLWTTVMDLVRDPQNGLPVHLRAMIVSVGLAVQREMQSPAVDFDFLMMVNEDVAAGLMQTGTRSHGLAPAGGATTWHARRAGRRGTHESVCSSVRVHRMHSSVS